MENILRPTYAEIKLEALRHNFRLLQAEAGENVSLLAVVKADAYGHGAVPVARALVEEGAPLLAVALIEEAIELRRAGITTPILVMGAVRPGNERYFIKYDLQPYVFDSETAERLSKAYVKAGRECCYHLKVDTGMGRIGVPLEDVKATLKTLERLDNMRMVGLMTHFARADEPEEDLTGIQVDRFRGLLKTIEQAGFAPEFIHSANSAGILSGKTPDCNLARPGIALYGGWPSSFFEPFDLRPVMNVRTEIVQVKTVSAGTGISYGHTYIADRPTRVATLPVGYADGYNRLLTNRGEVLVHGRRAPVIGTVCMDWIMVDVTDIDSASVGNEVTLLGDDGAGNVIRAEEWADKIGTINYEVFCGIGKRVPRKYYSET